MVKRIIYQCWCGKIHIKIPDPYCGIPICICGSDRFKRFTEKEYRELKLKRIIKNEN